MDKDRQIRFLYPPLIFMSSILLGGWLDRPNGFADSMVTIIENSNATNVIAALLGVGSLVLVFGYLIGTVTILMLRLVFINNQFNYEFMLPTSTYEGIRDLIFVNKANTIQDDEKMYAAVVF